MIEIVINGNIHQCPAGGNLQELMQHMQLEGKRIAIERNGAIVPKSLYAQTQLQPGDTLEVVVAVGGG